MVTQASPGVCGEVAQSIRGGRIGSFTHIGIGAAKISSGRWYGVQDFITK